MDYIYLDLNRKTTKSDTTAYLIVFGITGHNSSVDPTVYDNWYTINNGNMKMNINIDMGGNLVRKLKTPSLDDDAVNKQYVDTNFLNTNAGLTGNLTMNNHKITNLGLPKSNNDAVNKQFVINSSTIIYLYGIVDSRGIVYVDRFDLRIENVFATNV